VGSKERPTILDRLLEMVRGKGGTAVEPSWIDGQQVEPDRPRTMKKKAKKERGPHQPSECTDSGSARILC
jgi:hypothetical protein